VYLWPWLLVVFFLLLMEAYYLETGRDTLSRRVWKASKAWPLLPWVVGAVSGGLAVHFWWPWCPQ
jgi:hypothetical protein